MKYITNCLQCKYCELRHPIVDASQGNSSAIKEESSKFIHMCTISMQDVKKLNECQLFKHYKNL